MNRLAPINEVAYVRFVSVYRRFKDIDGFERNWSILKNVGHINRCKLQLKPKIFVNLS